MFQNSEILPSMFFKSSKLYFSLVYASKINKMLNQIKIKGLIFHMFNIIQMETSINQNDLLIIMNPLSQLKMERLRSTETSYQKFPMGKPY